MLGFQPVAARARTTSHSCVQMFSPSGNRWVSGLFVTKVEHVLLVAVSDLSPLATHRTVQTGRVGAQSPEQLLYMEVGGELLRDRAPCRAWREASRLPEGRQHPGFTGWFISPPTSSDAWYEGQPTFCDGHTGLLLWVTCQPLSHVTQGSLVRTSGG